MLSSKRLSFRAVDESDSAFIQELFNNIQIQQATLLSYPVPRSDHHARQFVKRCVDGEITMAVVVQSQNHTLGVAHLNIPHALNRDAEYSVMLLPQYWGNGYGSEVTKFMVDWAFHNMNMHRVSVQVFGMNDRGVVLLEKCGFVEEGRRRKALWSNGRWEDIILMGILDIDWASQRLQNSQPSPPPPNNNSHNNFFARFGGLGHGLGEGSISSLPSWPGE